MKFTDFSEEDLELITLRLVLLGDINNIKVFSYSISKEKRIQILKSLITSQPPSIYSPTKIVPSPLNIKWVASRLLLLEGYKDFPAVNFQELGFVEFSNMSDAITQFFKFSLSRVDSRPSDESKIISFAESFLQYYSRRITVADFLLKTYTDYIIQVPLSKLYRNFQFRCFLLINNLDKIDLTTLDVNFSNLNDYQPFKDLYQIHRGYQKEDFFPTIQKMIVNDKLFPSTIGNDPDKLIRSLIDTALIKKSHFVDVLREHSYFLFKEGKIEDSIEKAKLTKGIEPWIFISHYYSSIHELSPTPTEISNDDTVHFFQNMNYKEFENGENSIAADFLNRLQNDNSFFAMIRQNTGQTINSSLLYDHSIPFFLILFLKLADPLPFKDLNEIRLFCVNDEDRLIDADFVWSYFAEVVAINALTKPDEAEDMIAQSGWYLSQINHSKIQHEVLIDIFSILFLQQEVEAENNEKKKYKYVCYQSVAEVILTMILGMSDDDPILMQQAQNGHLLIQFARSISNGVDFEDLIFPKEQQLLNAFKNEDWLIADHIAALNVHLSDLNVLYKTVNDYLKKSNFRDFLKASNKNVDSFVSVTFDPKKSKSKFASVEIGLSFPDQIDSLKTASEISPISNDALELINKRYQKLLKKKKGSNNYNSLLRAVKTLNESDYSFIHQNFSDLNSTKWIISPYSNEQDETKPKSSKEHLHLLKSFLSYLDSLVGVVLNDEKLVDTIADVLKDDPSSFVNKLFNKGSIASAEKVSKVIKQDMMLMFASDNSASNDVICQLANENLPFALTLALTKEDGINENPIHEKNSIAFKIANISLKSNSRRKEQIEIIFGKSNNNNNESFEVNLKLKELKEIFENELLNDNFDIEKVVDISYSLNEEVFSNFVLQYIDINNDYLIKIIELVNRCGSINSKLYDLTMFLKFYLDSKIEIYPFENLFVYLLNNKKYKEASKFFRLFGSKINNYINHLINAYSNELKQNKISFSNSKYEILNISPEDKEEIESKAIILISHNLNIEIKDSISDEIEEGLFDDISEIKEKLISNPKIDFDNEIFNSLLFESENNIYAFCSSFRKAIHIAKNKHKIIEFALIVFEDVISQIQVNSIEMEDETWQFFDKIESIIEKHVLQNHSVSLNEQLSKKISEFLEKISIMKSVIDHSPFNLFNCEYNFFNFGKNLSFIFTKLDIVDSLLSYRSVFDISESQVDLDSYILNCCKLGIADFQIPYKIAQGKYECIDTNKGENEGEKFEDKNKGENEGEKVEDRNKGENEGEKVEDKNKGENEGEKVEDINKGENDDDKINVNCEVDKLYSCKRSLYENVSLLLTPEKIFFEPLLLTYLNGQFPPTKKVVDSILQIEDKEKSKTTITASESSFNIKDMQKLKKQTNRSVQLENDSDINDTNNINNNKINEGSKTAMSSISMPSLFSTDQSQNDHFFKRIQLISNKELSSIIEIDPMKKVRDFFKEKAPIDIVISYFASKGDLTYAINLLEESGKQYDKKCQQELFKNNFIEKVISRQDDIHLALKNVMTIDKELANSVLLDSCPYLRFDIYSFMKEWKQAYKAATDVFCIPTTDSNERRLRQLNLLSWMENCLEKIPEESEEKELEKICVALQKEVCHFAIDNKFNLNFSEANLFQKDLQKETVVIFLMTHFNIKLAIAVLRFFQLNRFRIGERSCDIFVNEDIKNVILFFKKFQREIDKEIFHEIFYAICIRMKNVLEVEQEIILSYINIIEDKEFKRKLLYQFGFLKEASDLAFAESDIEMIVLIANDAYILQKTSLLSKCLKFIEKKTQVK